MERRNSDRIRLSELTVLEKNGDYIYHFPVEDLSEEGIFVSGKFITDGHYYVSHLTLALSNGVVLENIPAKVIRESFGPNRNGVVFHFVSMDEETRIELKKYILERQSA